MKLLALHLSNVRKFTAKRASITGIGNGITVVSEANEFGKSTFFDAIHALFFEKYSSSAKPVKSLQPYAGGAVEVAADVETPDGIFRVEKRFLSKKSAKITQQSNGATIAQDDEAERWISALLGTTHDGPAGLLWVRQGLLGLDADSKKESAQLMETRRDLLSSVAGEIDTMTGGRRMDRVMRHVSEDLLEIATKTGLKRGPWKAAFDEAHLIADELARVTAQVTTLERALIDRNEAEAAKARLDNPDAAARRDAALSASQTAMEQARSHAEAVKAIAQDRDLAQLKSKGAQADLDAFLKAIDNLQTANDAAKVSTDRAQTAATQAEIHKAARDTASAQHAHALEQVNAARTQLDTARKQQMSQQAKGDATRLSQQIIKAQQAVSDRDVARAIVKQSKATPDWLRRTEDAQAQITQLTAALHAQATTLQMSYDGAARITRDGADLPADVPIVLDGNTSLQVPGLGQMVIQAKGIDAADRARLAATKGALRTILSEAGIATLEQARALTATRAQAENDATLAQAMLETLAPDGIAALQTAKAEADLAAQDAGDDAPPSITGLDTQLTQTQEVEAETRRVLERTDADHATAREAAATLQGTAAAAQQTLQQAETNAGQMDTRDARRADLLRTLAQEQAVLSKAQTNLQTLTDAAPDMTTVAAELKRAQDAVTTARGHRTQLGERLAALSSEIRTLAGNGIEERRDELTGALETMRTTEARFADKAAALTRLQSALEAQRDAARDTYFGPVQEELKPLLSILHHDAALQFDSESLLPTGFTRDTTQETLDDLSGGTKEQIAILTRLAFARLFARKGRQMPIILDDALVYSDDDRIIKMFTALTRVAQDQQIIVFSCRQLAFQDLGGARPMIEVVDL